MIVEVLRQLPLFCQGMIYFTAGMIVLLYALGIIEKGITLIIVVFGIFLICLGLIKLGLYQKIITSLKTQDVNEKKE